MEIYIIFDIIQEQRKKYERTIRIYQYADRPAQQTETNP